MRHAAATRWGLLVSLVLAGCPPQRASHKSSDGFPAFNVIRLYNDAPREIRDVELSAGGTVTGLAHLPAEHSPISDRGVSPDPQTATVKWRSADGRPFERTVQVAPNMPADFRGVIVLRLQETGDVAVEFVPYADLE